MKLNKNIKGGVALLAALSGMSLSGSAAALPELQVGTLPPIVAPSSVSNTDSTVAEPEDVDMGDTAS